MKQLTTAALLMGVALCAGTAADAADLSIRTVVAFPGTSAESSVVYRAEREEIAALQFDLEFDQSVLSVTATLGSAATEAGKLLAQAVLPNGNIRCLVYGLNQNVLSNGSVVDLTIQVSESAAVGPHRIDLVGALGASPSAEAVPIRVRFGHVIVRR